MGVTAAARGKLLLFGEHAAVYGHPAVGLSLPWQVRVVSTPGPTWELPGLGPYEPAVRTLIDRLGTMADEEGQPRPLPGLLEFSTEIPLGNGFGSSGALCAVLVNLFFPSLPLTAKDRLAWLAETQFHGTPSGIDTALALREGWWALDASTRPVTATALPDPGLVLVAGSVIRQSDTRTLIESLARRREAGDRVVIDTIEELGRISSQAVTMLKAQTVAELPSLIRRARHGLSALGLETPALTSVLDAGLGCPGALAGKLSGAGGGGAFFLAFSSEEAAGQAIPVIEQSVEAAQWTALPRLVVA